MQPINKRILQQKGFKFINTHPLIASLKIANNTYICLIKKENKWALGHSENNRDIYLRPTDYTIYQYIESASEIDSEIKWLTTQGIRNAIDYTLSLILSNGYDINDFLICTTDQAPSC